MGYILSAPDLNGICVTGEPTYENRKYGRRRQKIVSGGVTRCKRWAARRGLSTMVNRVLKVVASGMSVAIGTHEIHARGVIFALNANLQVPSPATCQYYLHGPQQHPHRTSVVWILGSHPLAKHELEPREFVTRIDNGHHISNQSILVRALFSNVVGLNNHRKPAKTRSYRPILLMRRRRNNS